MMLRMGERANDTRGQHVEFHEVCAFSRGYRIRCAEIFCMTGASCCVTMSPEDYTPLVLTLAYP